MSWFKNVITGGSHGKLESEIEDLNNLQEFASELSSVYSNLQYQQILATKILKGERSDAIRNINSAKTLMRSIKTNTKSSAKQALIQDFSLEIEVSEIDNNNSDLNVNFDNNLNAFTDTVFATLDTSINNSLMALEEKNDYSKASLKQEAISVGVDLAVNAISKGITEIVNANKQTNAKRRQVKEQLEDTHNYIKNVYKAIPESTAFVRRSIEISRVLNKNNQVFTTKYKEIHGILYENASIRTFFSKKLICNKDEDIKKVINLMIICSNYSKLNKNARLDK